MSSRDPDDAAGDGEQKRGATHVVCQRGRAAETGRCRLERVEPECDGCMSEAEKGTLAQGPQIKGSRDEGDGRQRSPDRSDDGSPARLYPSEEERDEDSAKKGKRHH